MKDPFLHKKFIFNEKIDTDFLYNLYEDDFVYIEEIFKTSFDQLVNVLPEIPLAFNNKDIVVLRKLVHKIKPSFGFTGLLKTEQACKEFEDACTEKNDIDDLATSYHSLWSLLAESMDIMQKQFEKLKEFNKS